MTAEFVMNAKYALIPRKQRLKSAKDRNENAAPEVTKIAEHERTAGENGFDPYQVLRVTRGASKEEIKAAYFNLIKQYHPDKVSHLGQEFQKLADEKARLINRAYEILMAS
jgi:DnaJ like chaperone protein